jgi:triacylglycerol esterase/lipase EstA (alpha/beta hydrolase family)
MALGALLGTLLAGSGPHFPVGYAMLGALCTPLFLTLTTLLYGAVASRPGESSAAWWRALTGECSAGIPIFLFRQPWAFAAPKVYRHTGSQERVPVVLIHGFGCNHRVWDAMVPDLLAQGHTVLAIDLEPPFTSIDDYAPQVEQAVQTLCAATGRKTVALVAHSMGGLATRAWMRRYGSAQAAGVVTLGTPHAGTRIANWVGFPNTRQMAWHSEWLAALAATETDATRSKFRIGISSQDNIVFPQREQVLPGRAPRVFEGHGHLQLCTSPKVRRWVCQELVSIP